MWELRGHNQIFVFCSGDGCWLNVRACFHSRLLLNIYITYNTHSTAFATCSEHIRNASTNMDISYIITFVYTLAYALSFLSRVSTDWVQWLITVIRLWAPHFKRGSPGSTIRNIPHPLQPLPLNCGPSFLLEQSWAKCWCPFHTDPHIPISFHP